MSVTFYEEVLVYGNYPILFVSWPESSEKNHGWEKKSSVPKIDLKSKHLLTNRDNINPADSRPISSFFTFLFFITPLLIVFFFIGDSFWSLAIGR